MHDVSGTTRRDITLLYAFDEGGAHVRYERAVVGQAYICVGCGKPVTFRNGHERVSGIWRPHFAHTTVSDGCGESADHKSAILLIVERIQPSVGSREPKGPWVSSRCPCCKREERPYELEAHFDRAKAEVRADAEIADPARRSAAANRIPDVTVSSSSCDAQLYVEVFHAHRVGEEKAKDYASKRWIEVVAREILERPNYWRFDGPDCAECVRKRAVAVERKERDESDRLRKERADAATRARIEAVSEDELLAKTKILAEKGAKIRDEIARRLQPQIMITTRSGEVPLDRAEDADVLRASAVHQRMLRLASERLKAIHDAKKEPRVKVAMCTAIDVADELQSTTESWPRRR